MSEAMEVDLREVGRRIAQHRSRVHMSQGELADAVGVGQSTISSLETAKIKTPPLELLYHIADVLGVQRSYIVLLSPDPKPTPAQSITMDTEERLLLERVRLLDPANRLLILRLVSAMASMQTAVEDPAVHVTLRREQV